ncbi:hypothetical protein KFL_000960040 [Klebsormidium nitens]|uniref:Complex 1 LYR protein domain-containing protein n=1 Tax=Klebsormidium nitens TaxID=105231 RepID=A0A0U9HN86_KLENI|nr:hypothetical protein KFL_000960040 [Klebsormidium nitens]|eukprot:GAQ81953.1 hypothetical protein KFL_000960040 [Klebsormidium nitens]
MLLPQLRHNVTKRLLLSGRPLLVYHYRHLNTESSDSGVEALIEQNLAPRTTTVEEAARAVTSTRREALSLYRSILRGSRFFVWTNKNGVLWKDMIQQSARSEFEAARHETDPEVVTRLIIGGRDAVEKALEKFIDKTKQIVEHDTPVPNG